MASPASPSTAAGGRAGVLARLFASRWTLVVAAVVAVALIVSAAVAAVRFLAPQSTALTVGTPMPSSFALDLLPASSPFVSRGGTASVVVHATPTDNLDRLELWADDTPFIVIDDPELLPLDSAGKISLMLDYVPMRAGAHTLMVRAVDAKGLVAQSSPMAIPTLDLPSETGAVLLGNTLPAALAGPDLDFRSAPGDTLQSIADRLGLLPGDLHAFSPLPQGVDALAAGTRLAAHLPTVDKLGTARFHDLSWASEITAKRNGCIVTVTSTASHTMRIYGGPGNAALGDVKVDSPLVLSALPIGPTTLVGLEPNVSEPSTKEGYGPTIPVTVTIPDDCAKGGWEGSAYVNGGILITDEPVEDAYAYISVDKGQWQRVPAAEGSSFGSGSGILNDLRSYINLDHYDQIDLEVWSARDGEAQRRATGAFCRASMTNPQPGGSSGSGGECQPPGASPGVVGTAVAAGLTLSAQIVSPQSAWASLDLTPDDDDRDSFITMNAASDLVLTTDAAAVGYQSVMYQFSYFPLSPTSPLVDPPGVFYTVTAPAGSKTTVKPWAWHDMKLAGKDLASTDLLSLDDELALATAKANLTAGRNLVDDLYIRAIAVSSTSAPITSLGGASNNIAVVMPSSLDGSWPTIKFPQVSLVSGVDQSASYASKFIETSPWNQSVQRYDASSVNDNCFDVAAYPNQGTWNLSPSSGPRSRPAWAVKMYGTGTDDFDKNYYDYWGRPKPGDTQVSAGYPSGSDYALAVAAWPRQDVIYCMDDNADGRRYTEAYEANKKANECGFGCVMSFIVYGAIQGFVVGGPYGALVGAMAGLAIGLISTQNPEFYADLKSVWDKIAGVYNAVFDQVWAFVDKTNLFCIGLKALAGHDAGSFCDTATHAVGSAVITYYTGLPPRLANSSQLDAIADGDAEAAVVQLLESTLAEFGIPLTCDTLSLDSTESAALARLGDEFGVDTGAAQDSSGKLSGCGAIARAFVKELRTNMKTRAENLMSTVTGEPAIPGLVLSPVSDLIATVKITGTPTDAASVMQTCPIIINQTVTENGLSYRFPAQTARLSLRYAAKPIDGSPRPAPQWSGSFPVGIIPQVFFKKIPPTGPEEYDWYHREWTTIDPDANGITVSKAEATAMYLAVSVDSPCFSKSFTIAAPKYKNGAAPGVPVFAIDSRPAVAYY